MQSLCNFSKKFFVLLLPICEATEDKIDQRGYYTHPMDHQAYISSSPLLLTRHLSASAPCPFSDNLDMVGDRRDITKTLSLGYTWSVGYYLKKTCVYDCEVLILILNAANFQQRI